MYEFWRAFLLAKKQWKRHLIAEISLICDTASLILVPLILKNLFDVFSAALPRETILREINRGVLYVILLAFLRSVITYLGMYFQEATGNYISHDLRQLLFGKILRFPFKFFDTRKTGDLMSVLTRDVDANFSGWL